MISFGNIEISFSDISTVFWLSALVFLIVFTYFMGVTGRAVGKSFFGVKDWNYWLANVLIVIFVAMSVFDGLWWLFFVILCAVYIHEKKNMHTLYRLSNRGSEILFDIVLKEQRKKGRDLKILDVAFPDRSSYDNYGKLDRYPVVAFPPNKSLFWYMKFVRALSPLSPSKDKIKIIEDDVLNYSFKEADVILMNVQVVPAEKLDDLCNKIKKEFSDGIIITMGRPLQGFRLKEDFSSEGIFVYEV